MHCIYIDICRLVISCTCIVLCDMTSKIYLLQTEVKMRDNVSKTFLVFLSLRCNVSFLKPPRLFYLFYGIRIQMDDNETMF